MAYVPSLHDVSRKYKMPEPKTTNEHINHMRKSKYYLSHAWQNTRRGYLMQHPICELSIRSQRAFPAETVHHIIKWDSQPTEELKWALLTDIDNLISLTTEKHLNIHYRRSLLTDDEVSYLAERKMKILDKYMKLGLLLNDAPDSNIETPERTI